ncbi:hypothetical protein DPSP01_006116 [Paraphaeosphaeria sporulosa]|uniref:Uncharacterized protein n=1 Tax=Paraphaeosphaeria sporulosa TaxID=1460663 RepID=A0A177BV18_9PLEO|nr:uncharacterized protein CC84DRAFT_426374 [Paraphaeosphaeria sporulosa]OAF98820.1 hypothetical protein CC84DRAFT_426374 [Paraphaeosphaeria sporulosa]
MSASPFSLKIMSSPSWVSRVLPASIFIILSVLCFFLMDMISLIVKFPSPTASGFIKWGNGTLPILDKFHWLRPLDPIIREITPGFAPSSFGYDDVSRWQMMNFIISDPGMFYAIWGFESLRKGVRDGPAFYPGVFGLIAQFGGGGVIIPIYYFSHLAFTPPIRSRPLSERKIDIIGASVWSILIVLFHVVPVVGIMFDTTLKARHWWTWFWQLYTVRITMAWYIIKSIGNFVNVPRLHCPMSYRTKTALVLAPFIAIAVGLWTYTILCCPHSLSTVFYPHSLTEDTWVLRMRRILQFDQLFIWGSSVLWVAMDMRRNRISSGVEILLAGVLLACISGTGGSFGLVWLWRECKLTSNIEKEVFKDE